MANIDIEGYIRRSAAARGIDPDIAIRVANSEGGLRDPFRQSDFVKNGVRERSYGPFQLYMDGGLGNEAMKAGIDPRKDWQAGVDFALDNAAKGGWSPWYGAAKAGIGDFDGLRGAKPAGVTLNSVPAVGLADGPKGQEMYDLGTAPNLLEGTKFSPSPSADFPAAPAAPTNFSVIADAFKGQGFMGGMNALGKSPIGKGALGLMGAMMGGGGGQKQDAPLQSSLPAIEAADAQRRLAASQAANEWSNRRRRGYGVSLMG